MPASEHWMTSARRHPSSRWRRGGGGLFLVLFGGVFLYFLVPEILANLAAASWTPASCTILSSGVTTQESRDGEERQTLYRVDVRYAYDAAAGRLESTRYRFVDPFTDNRAAAETAAARYAAGAVVPCFVDPDDSAQAVLDRRLSPFMLIVLLPAAIAGLGLWSLLGIAVETVREFVRPA
jgi:hypothetical protein